MALESRDHPQRSKAGHRPLLVRMASLQVPLRVPRGKVRELEPEVEQINPLAQLRHLLKALAQLRQLH